MDITLNVNGHTHQLAVDPRLMLLDALREVLGLTGTNKAVTRARDRKSVV